MWHITTLLVVLNITLLQVDAAHINHLSQHQIHLTHARQPHYKVVVAHFMVGNTFPYQVLDWVKGCTYLHHLTIVLILMTLQKQISASPYPKELTPSHSTLGVTHGNPTESPMRTGQQRLLAIQITSSDNYRNHSSFSYPLT